MEWALPSLATWLPVGLWRISQWALATILLPTRAISLSTPRLLLIARIHMMVGLDYSTMPTMVFRRRLGTTSVVPRNIWNSPRMRFINLLRIACPSHPRQRRSTLVSPHQSIMPPATMVLSPLLNNITVGWISTMISNSSSKINTTTPCTAIPLLHRVICSITRKGTHPRHQWRKIPCLPTVHPEGQGQPLHRGNSDGRNGALALVSLIHPFAGGLSIIRYFFFWVIPVSAIMAWTSKCDVVDRMRGGLTVFFSLSL